MAKEYLDAASLSRVPTDAKTAAFNAELEAELQTVRPITDFDPAEVRAARESGESIWGPIVTVEDAETRTVTHDGCRVPVRVIVPAEVRGVYLHIHGGGWTLGAAHHCDVRNLATASAAGLAVVSVEYRLAPEHPHPAAADDCETVAAWLLQHAQEEFGSDRLLIGGESAGAHLSAVTLIRMRDRHAATEGFKAANLVYGCYDVGMTPSAANWGDRNLVLSTPIIEWFANHFVDATQRRDPDVSPLYADLAGLPKALFTVGTLDPLLDDSLFMHARWLASGNDAELALYPGAVHGFNAFPIPIADEANSRMHRFLANAV